MRSRPLDTTADDAVPEVTPPEPDTDRGVPEFLGVPTVAFAVAVFVPVLIGAITGDPVTWSDATGVVSNGLAAGGIVAGFRWFFDRDE